MRSKPKPIHLGIVIIVLFSLRQAPKLEPCQNSNNIGDYPSARREVGQFSYLPKGRWIKGRKSEHAAPICCGWDLDNYMKVPECGRVPMPRVNGGGWRGRPDFYAHLGGYGCSCKNFQDDYEWSETPSWNAYDTCQKLNGRRVLLIGDSTMGQVGTTLMNALHPAGCQINITCVESDTLINKEMGHLNRGPHWFDSVKQNKGWADIVIISAGPHIYGRNNFNLVVESIINGTRTLKKDNPNMEVIWKTQPPAGCTSEPTTMIEFSGDYQYNEFYERDMYCLNELPRHGIHVLDLRMLYYRSDAHIHSGHHSGNPKRKDCMHMCLPGPLDIIAPLFSQLLDRI